MSITGILAKPFVAVSDYFEGKDAELASVDIKYEDQVLFKTQVAVRAALDPRCFEKINVLMAILDANSAHWHLHTAEKTICKARWTEHMRSVRGMTVSQERWNNLSNLASMLVMGLTAGGPKFADKIFESPPPWMDKIWNLFGGRPQEAIRLAEWRKMFLDTFKAGPTLVQGMSQARQQTGQMEIQTRSMQTQSESEAMRNKSEAASGNKQDSRTLKELIDRLIQNDPNNTLIRAANGA